MPLVLSSALSTSARIGVSVGLLGLGLVGATLGAPPTPATAAGKKVCTIKDERLIELSGLVAVEGGYIVVNDSSDLPERNQIFYLDSKCKVTDTVGYPGDGPRDTEDLALSPDGKTLWIADTGDNVTSSERRSSVALWSMPVDGSEQPVRYRLTYADKKPRDVEALLIGDDGTPYLITKNPGTAHIFRPTAELTADGDERVPLEQVGEFRLPRTNTSNPFGAAGRMTVTGAARSPDGKRVALRTYADAFEWDVEDGDIVKALTTGRPRVTALSDVFGEAIAYTPDGTKFVTVSDVGSLGEQADVVIRSYEPAQKLAEPAADTEEGGDGRSWLDRLTLSDITYLLGGVGVLGVLLVGLGVFGIIRARRRPGVRAGARPLAGEMTPDPGTWERAGGGRRIGPVSREPSPSRASPTVRPGRCTGARPPSARCTAPVYPRPAPSPLPGRVGCPVAPRPVPTGPPAGSTAPARCTAPLAPAVVPTVLLRVAVIGPAAVRGTPGRSTASSQATTASRGRGTARRGGVVTTRRTDRRGAEYPGGATAGVETPRGGRGPAVSPAAALGGGRVRSGAARRPPGP
jgi:hypothetical protein